jgi:hypothetical protein
MYILGSAAGRGEPAGSRGFDTTRHKAARQSTAACQQVRSRRDSIYTYINIFNTLRSVRGSVTRTHHGPRSVRGSVVQHYRAYGNKLAGAGMIFHVITERSAGYW